MLKRLQIVNDRNVSTLMLAFLAQVASITEVSSESIDTNKNSSHLRILAGEVMYNTVLIIFTSYSKVSLTILVPSLNQDSARFPKKSPSHGRCVSRDAILACQI